MTTPEAPALAARGARAAGPPGEPAALTSFRADYQALLGRPELTPVRWLGELRQRAFEAFARRGLPTTRDELWRTTSVAPIARARFRRPPPELQGRVPAALLERLGFSGAFHGREIVCVNGRLAPGLSSLGALRGARVRGLREALASEGERLAAAFGRVAGDFQRHPFAALNTALFEDGVLVELADGVTEREPIHLLHLSVPGEGEETAAAFPRTLVRAGRGSQVRLVETFGGHAGDRGLTNAVTEVALDDGAQVDLTRLQRESDAAWHVAFLGVQQARDTRFVDHAVAAGAALARCDVDVTLAGEGAECVLDGLFMGGGSQHLDTHTRIDHARPHCRSRELYKGVLEGRARGVFHGLVVVREGAQKTDALQANKNLLLSREALVDSTPQLEIHADDVKCKHGSTTGQLDPQALFYLRSRGIGAEAAQALLTYAFASEIAQRIEVEPVRARLTQYLYERLPQAPRQEEA